MSGATAIITLNAWIGMGLFGMERATSANSQNLEDMKLPELKRAR